MNNTLARWPDEINRASSRYEKSRIHALDRGAPILPKLPGTLERAVHDHKRGRTSSLYAALDLTTSKGARTPAQPRQAVGSLGPSAR